MKRKRTFIACLVLMWLLNTPFVSIGVASVAKEEIIERLATREQNIKSLMGKFDLRAQYLIKGKLEELEKSYRWILKEKMQRLSEEYISLPKCFKESDPNTKCGECSAIIETSRQIRIFDGEITKTLFVEKKQGMVHRGDYVSIGKTPADWLLLRFGSEKRQLSAFLKQQDISVIYAGKVRLEERECHLLEFSKREKTKGKLYLSEQEGLAPVRFVTEIRNESAPFNTKAVSTFNKFHKYGDIWLPQEMTCTVYNVYTNKEEIAMKEVISVSQLQLNTEIPFEEFTLKFPLGTHVYDSILKIDYTVQ